MLPLIMDCILISLDNIGFDVTGDAILIDNVTDATTPIKVETASLAYVMGNEGTNYTLVGSGVIEPYTSDRAAWDAANFASRHANDIGVGIHWTQADLDTLYAPIVLTDNYIIEMQVFGG